MRGGKIITGNLESELEEDLLTLRVLDKVISIVTVSIRWTGLAGLNCWEPELQGNMHLQTVT